MATNKPKKTGKVGGKRVSNTSLSSPFRRELMGMISFFLGLFCLFGYFNTEAVFIEGFTRLLKGLVGVGFWLYAPLFFISSYILMCHRGRPVMQRVVCGALIPVFFSCMCYGFIRSDNRPPLRDFMGLWDLGQSLEGCGVVGSLIGGLCTMAFTGVGTIIVFLFLTAFLILGVLDRSVMDLIDWYAARPQYEPMEKPEKPQKIPKPEKKVLKEKKANDDALLQEEAPKKTKKKAPPVEEEPLEELEEETEEVWDEEEETWEGDAVFSADVTAPEEIPFFQQEPPEEEEKPVKKKANPFHLPLPFDMSKKGKTAPIPPLIFPDKINREKDEKSFPLPAAVFPDKKEGADISQEVFSPFDALKVAPAELSVPDPLNPKNRVSQPVGAPLSLPEDHGLFNKEKAVPTPDQLFEQGRPIPVIAEMPMEQKAVVEENGEPIVTLPVAELPLEAPQNSISPPKMLRALDIQIADDPTMRTIAPKVEGQENTTMGLDALSMTTAIPTLSGTMATGIPPVVSAPLVTAPMAISPVADAISALTVATEEPFFSSGQDIFPQKEEAPPVEEEIILPEEPPEIPPQALVIAETAPSSGFQQPYVPDMDGPTINSGFVMPSYTEEDKPILDLPPTVNSGIPYKAPPLSLLKQGSVSDFSAQRAELEANRQRLEDTLHSFSINAKIHDVTQGPSVTRYEVMLEQGVKLSKIVNLSDDIALALGATGVRIAPIPEKISMVGIEVPNKAVTPVEISTVIGSANFLNSDSKVSFAVGKDINGSAIVGNISKFPHLLVAGTTGSGKSVCTNSLIISLLYKASPEEVRLIMVDPKMVELQIYNGIPHLLIPVVTDPKKAAGALQWAVTEMMKRYRLFSEVGTRDLSSYNAMAESRDDMEKMPQIVVVIDELADLMLVAAKEVEESICRVAQMGRASGMHLIVATQRPSADVITGLMKANIPSRISFAVSSGMESRIILDTQGAEKLVGRGDMLYAPLGEGKPTRVQGCLISDSEVAFVVDYVKQHNSTASYSDEIMEEIDQNVAAKEKNNKNANAQPSLDDSDQDEMLDSAIDVVLDMKQASTSMIQRRLKLGYARAARIVDQMEDLGVVGPSEGSKPRQLLITKEQWQEMKYRRGGSTAAVADSTTEQDGL